MAQTIQDALTSNTQANNTQAMFPGIGLVSGTDIKVTASSPVDDVYDTSKFIYSAANSPN